ncbi:MAG: TonB-dependent receptor domain-containing protein [Chitinophagaceae bacterium]
MRKLLSILLVFGALFNVTIANAQTTVKGSVKTTKSKEAISAVSVTIKGGVSGTYTDDKGNFKFTTSQKPPFTLVFSSVGYTSKEVNYTGAELNVELDVTYALGTEVTVSASRVAERVLESPVTIERVSAAAIRNTPAVNYYDMLTNLKGVDVVSASLTFRSVGTRGFNSSGNLRLTQIVDGMDNQAPGLNFAVGSIVGLTELDVESMELLPGASSALYGPGGMNGTVIINGKDPFKYQGLSFQTKFGVNHVDNFQRDMSPFFDWTVRYAKKMNDKWAYKIGAQLIQAKDWVATDATNYSRLTGTPNGQVKPGGGSRMSDPDYDGVNFYGDETRQNMSSIANSVRAAAAAGGAPLGTLDAAAAGLSLAAYTGLLPASLQPFAPILYGSAPSRNYFNNQNVSRTGYLESDVIDPTTVNVKLSGALHYKITDKLTAIGAAYFGTGNTVYTGSDRYSLKNLVMAQYKLELKSKNWVLRAYRTEENSGNSFNATIATRLFNEAWKPSTTWYPQYMSAYANARSLGAADATAHNGARQFADQGRPTGFIGGNSLFQAIVNRPIGAKTNGGQFLDKSTLSEINGQWNLSELIGLNKDKTDFLIGGNARTFTLNSQGTLFADSAAPISINEIGAYAQLSHKFFGDRLKITASGRYDKNTNFEGRFTPRFSAVVKLAQDHNVRASYQTAYRFPSTQNQWINLEVSGGTRLMGGLPQLRDYYNFGGNPAYTLQSVQAFGTAFVTSVISQGGNPAAPTPTQAGIALAAAAPSLQRQNFEQFRPESMTSIEFGYKGLIGKKLLIDAYYYQGTYKDFIGGVVVLQPAGGNIANLLGANRTAYSISTNLKQDVTTKGWGLGLEYQMPNNFFATANVYSDEIGAVPTNFVSYFNTPKYRANFGFGNNGFLTDKRYGFNVMVRTQEGMYYEGTFGTSNMPGFTTIDAMVSYKLPKLKSLLKVGGTNIMNNYFRTGFGSPAVGGLYYVSFAYNVF